MSWAAATTIMFTVFWSGVVAITYILHLADQRR
jgi:hypothetical protein